MITFDFKSKPPEFDLDWWPKTQKQWAPKLLAANKAYWPIEADPNNGRPWKALTPKYALAKLKKYPGQPILRATGKMQDNAKVVPFGTGFQVLTTLYGPYHQTGTRKMVARPWFGLPNQSLNVLASLSWKNILRKM